LRTNWMRIGTLNTGTTKQTKQNSSALPKQSAETHARGDTCGRPQAIWS